MSVPFNSGIITETKRKYKKKQEAIVYKNSRKVVQNSQNIFLSFLYLLWLKKLSRYSA
jgi:hypothetical protein